MNECICGGQIPENARFCPACGCPVVSVPECPSIAASETLFEETTTEAPEAVRQTEIAADSGEAKETLPECGGIPENVIDEIRPDPTLPVKKRRPVLAPVLVMAAMLIIGTICFFLYPDAPVHQPADTEPAMQESETTPTKPGQSENQKPGGGLRSEDFVPTGDDCFVMTEEGLRFLAHKYDGGSVLVIPEQIGSEKVTSIAPGGFVDCAGVTTLILPDTLEHIGNGAFEGCRDLRGIWLPEAVRTVGENAFRDCISLEAVSVPGCIEVIGSGAFTGCASLFYFFYDGYYDHWLSVYNEYVTPYTSVSCLDGDYYHGVKSQ